MPTVDVNYIHVPAREAGSIRGVCIARSVICAAIRDQVVDGGDSLSRSQPDNGRI